MNFSKYKKSVIACILALGIGVGGGYYFFGSPVNTPVSYTHLDVYKRQLHTWAEEQWKTIDNHTSLNRGEVEKPLRVGLVLGTSWATKEWPQEKWYSLIISLQYRANFVCLGGPKEATQYKPLMNSLAAEGIDQIMLNMLGKTTLQEVGALIESCDVVVTADTGSLHICLLYTSYEYR